MKKILLITCLLLLCSCTKVEVKKCPEILSKSFNIHFNTNGGNEMEPLEYEVDSNISIEDPVREGYRFGGWYYEESFLSKFDGNVVLDYTRDSSGCENGYRDINLYALWFEK